MMGSFGIVLALAAAAASQGAPPKDAAERSADPLDKVICKRFTETGSLVKGKRVCKTKREWENERDAAVRSMTTGGACGNAGNGGICN